MKNWIREGEEELREVRNGELVCLSWKALEEAKLFRQAFSTRQGGLSEGFLSTMNFSFERGDDPAHVMENYRRIAATIGVDPGSFVVAHQTHTVNIRAVTEGDRGCGVLRPRPYDDVDGLMTNVPGLTLVTYHADCLPVYLADPVRRAIALLHAGWKGTVDQIAGRAVMMMREQYGTDPGDLIACIGPGICRSCYEIGEDVAQQFRAVFTEAENVSILTEPHRKEDGMHWQLDLKEANRRILVRAGVPEEQIHLADICTRCNSERLFSHRAHGVRRGLNAAFLSIKE